MPEQCVKVEKDFQEIADVILKKVSKVSPKLTRCHEMAYIINKGMVTKGHETIEKHGYYFDAFPLLSLLYKGFMDHSWVKDRPTGMILDAYCNRPAGPNGETVCSRPQFEVVKRRRDKAKYVPWKINYTLREGTVERAKELFGL
jgi:hypothetical protein